MKLLWSPLAEERVGEIAAWIQEESPQAAARWVEEIFSAVERLQQFPESGRHVPEVEHRQDLREVIHQSYRIIYRLEAACSFSLFGILGSLRRLRTWSRSRSPHAA